MKIASGIATAAVAAGSLGLVVGPANAAPDQMSDRSSSVQARQQGDTNFKPTLEKVNQRKILAEAQNINRKTTVKLMVDRNGSWETLQVWNPDNARPRDFAQTVNVKRVGKIQNYILRVVDRNSRGRVTQVQDSNDRDSRGRGSTTDTGTGSGSGPLGLGL